MSDFGRQMRGFTDDLKAGADFTKAMEAVSIELRFDPDDPASVAAAVADMEKRVDAVAARWPGSKTVATFASGIKESYRNAIRDQKQDAAGEDEPNPEGAS